MYLVRKWDDIDNYLTNEQREMLSAVLYRIDYCRHRDGKKDNTYLVVNTDEPYAKQVAEIMVAHGHCAKDCDEDVIEIEEVSQ